MVELHRCGLIAPHTQVVREGSEAWEPFQIAFPLAVAPRPGNGSSLAGATWNKMAGGISHAAGLERLDGMQAKGVFQEIFRKHTLEEMEECFAVGTLRTTPAWTDVQRGWPAPWVFVRLMTFSVLLAVVFTWALVHYGNMNLYPGWIFMGAFSIPFSVMVFFLETNVLRNISFYRILKLFLFGGFLSLVFTLFINEQVGGLFEWLGPAAAGPIEELAKLVAVVAIARNWRGTRWTLNGMLLGAAVGAGFAAFETSGYILHFDFTDSSGGLPIMILRGLLAPFTHVIWTASTAGALWRRMGERSFSPAMLVEWPVLRILLIAIGFHMLWNSDLTVPLVGGYLGYLLKYLLLGAMGWSLVLVLIQDGIAQVTMAIDEWSVASVGSEGEGLLAEAL